MGEEKHEDGADFSLGVEVIKKRTASGIASLLLRTLFLQAVTFIASIFVSRFLSPFAFGVYGIVANFVLLFVFFSDIGLAAALVQKKDKLTRQDLTTTFTIQQALVLGLMMVIFILLPVIQPLLKFDNDGLWLGRALAFSLVLASLKSIPSVLLERRLKFNLLIIPEIAETVVFNLVLVALAASGYGVKSFVWAVLARGLVGVIAIYIISPWRIGFGFNRQAARALVHFGFPFQINSILAWFKDSLMDNVVAIILHSPTSFGYLSWARNLSYQPKKIMDSIIRVTFPVYSRLQDKRDVLSEALGKTYFLLGVLMFPAITGICVLVKPLILFLFGGPKWLPAVPSVYFLSLTLLWGLFNSVATNTLSAIGQIKTVLKFMIMVTAATWLLTPAFTLLWGFNGAALSWVISGFVSIWSIKKCAREVKMNFVRDMRGAFLASLAMGILAFVLGQFWISSLLQLVLTIVLSIIVYLSMIFSLEKERLLNELKSVLGSRFNFSSFSVSNSR